ncbi:exodeoxyribonuclease VII large subunit [Pseudarthrobacter sp. N5]|uniref:exodeoxyribonuclease VII large subunit n=1 Tax=Pseudarthrobacter sp. N5 TaxID=3418416 RepID=UPI003CF7E2FD
MSEEVSASGLTPASTGTTLPATAAETSPDNPWPLQLLSQKLKAHIDRTPSAWVEGQVIELNRRGNTAYLTIRDVDAEVSLPASIWSNVLDRQAGTLQSGSRVVALLKPEFWLKTGRLSMQVKDIRPVGLGDLLARIERLRQALALEGLFADSRKKRLPLLPHRIGLITGRDSDAKKDVLRNAALRWPAVEFEIREVAVQGNTAVAQVTGALRELDARPDVDVIVIARGGGALEDLLPFSSEELIRAVSDALTPVVSAIGHEADRPILDDVADLRASTPTDAAKRIVPDVGEELARVRQARDQVRRSVTSLVDRETDRLFSLRSRPVLAAPEGMVMMRADDVERLRRRSLAAVQTAVVRASDQLLHLTAQVRALSPQQTLDRGYAVVQLTGDGLPAGSRGDVVRHPVQVPAGTGLSIRVAGGSFGAHSNGNSNSNSTLDDNVLGNNPTNGDSNERSKQGAAE